MKTTLLTAAAALWTVTAAAAPEGYFDLKPPITIESGDTWNDGTTRYSLYGVQACLRGTTYTDNANRKRDCGEASMAMLGAFIKDTTPICAPVIKTPDLVYVLCYATVGTQRMDLGLLLVNSGYAFASLNSEGRPHHMAYALAEQNARQSRAGLWQFDDVVHPAILKSATSRQDAAENAQ